MSRASRSKIRAALNQLAASDVKITEILTFVLSSDLNNNDFVVSNIVRDLSDNYLPILDLFQSHPLLADKTNIWTFRCATKALIEDVKKLAKKSSGWHGHAMTSSIDQFEATDFGSLSQTAKNISPMLWGLLDQLLSVPRVSGDEEDGDDGDDDGGGGVLHQDEQGTRRVSQHASKEVRELRNLVIVSIICKTNNQHCNRFASLMGLFLHACGASQRIISCLSQIGLSTSPRTIDRIVNFLSEESANRIKAAGRSLTCTMVYDNLVVDFGSPTQSAIDRSDKTLYHFTTGTYINHHNDMEDLRCVNEVQAFDPHNDRGGINKEHGFDHISLMQLHSASLDAHGLSVHQRYFAWALRRTLCTHGPSFFRAFLKNLGAPETIHQIPVRKTEQVPVKAMRLDNSTVSGNIDAIEGILEQGGLKKKDQPGQSEDYVGRGIVKLVCGDLGTAERIESGKRRRAMDLIESNRLFDMVFVPGMFHVKMALVDMLWRLFIKPFAQESDPTSAVVYARYLCPRPKDTNKLLKGPPTYQQMKRFLNHIGVADQLCCWKTVLTEQFGPTAWTEFDDEGLHFIISEQLKWEDILELSYTMAKTYFDFSKIIRCRKSSAEPSRDKQLENTMLRNTYILLYDETVYAMNWGDIGRLEKCLITWLPAFRGVGKHKYAFHLMKFYVKLNFVYPEKLRTAIQHSLLSNLSGKAGKFQGNDWVVELNNFYTKVTYGGKYSNRTAEQLIKESPLIFVYRNILNSVEAMCMLGHRGRRHAEPDMTKTYAQLVKESYSNKLFEEVKGRGTVKEILDAFSEGNRIINLKGWAGSDTDNNEEETPLNYDEDDLIDGVDTEE